LRKHAQRAERANKCDQHTKLRLHDRTVALLGPRFFAGLLECVA
jgi:hypothetical protein